MDYEKKYRDLVKAVKELQGANPHDEGIQKWVEDNVPQLAESEDEKIRKQIKAFIKSRGSQITQSKTDAWLAWLEKQKPIEDFNGDDYGIDSLWHAITILEKTLGEVEGYQTDDGILEHKCAITAVRKLAKERREQKPVEEIKGVSHKWYMCIEGVENFTKGCLYVSNIDDQGTEWMSDDTGHVFLYGHYSRYFRPTTEKEIPHKPKFKVGDWVVDNQGLCHRIEKVVENVTNHTYGYDIVGGGYFNDSSDVHLLTIEDVKQQRDTLMKAIADAEYTIDFDKKELKKIEQKPEMIQWTGNNLREVADFTGVHPMFSVWFKTWEDYETYVHNHDDIYKLFDGDGNHMEVPVGAWIMKAPDGYCVASKYRFVQKRVSDWSSKDQAHLESIDESLFMFESGRHENVVEGIEDDRNWLKSLKGRVGCEVNCTTTWKPSDAQIGALEHFVRSITESGFASPYDSNTKLVYSLFNDLKKLREE